MLCKSAKKKYYALLIGKGGPIFNIGSNTHPYKALKDWPMGYLKERLNIYSK